jgi:hypothetical protein
VSCSTTISQFFKKIRFSPLLFSVIDILDQLLVRYLSLGGGSCNMGKCKVHVSRLTLVPSVLDEVAGSKEGDAEGNGNIIAEQWRLQQCHLQCVVHMRRFTKWSHCSEESSGW